MNNLLRTLTESQSLSGAAEQDLKLLLNSVKEARKQCHDAKTSDAFYESLDGLLQDLRMVTMDNRDAEAFLKPVSKTEVPDYGDVITHPMDLQTMQRKVKAKQYRSKREFKDDLDLIWSNCFTYNATENHPLRQCAARLKVKAEQLLKNITDRKERLDPSIPSELMSRSSTPKLNGATNGHAVARPRPVAFTKSPSPAKAPIAGSSRRPRRDVPFPESPAIVRTAEGMAAFVQLDQELDRQLDRALGEAGLGGSELEERLKEYAEGEAEADGDDSSTNDGEVGEKRKRSPLSDSRPRKRARVTSADKDVVDLWWDAMHSDAMLANGLPVLRFASSEGTSDAPLPREINDPPRKPGVRPRKKRKKLTESRAKKTLLYHMNNNIRTLRRIRSTHARLTVLKESNDETSGSGTGQGGFFVPPPPPPPPDDVVDDEVDDRPWSEPMHGMEIGEKNADDCMHWMGSKVLEHVGFQGASSVALDVLAGVASDYLLTVGRNIHHLCDKYGNKMTPEEIILHTLFESGITRVYDLERYVKDDVVRFGARMTDLEKKLGSAYMEATSDHIWDDETLFKMDEEEGEDGEFVMGNFADSFGEDFLGLRELGIAAEFGLNSLTIPKRLLKGKNKAGVTDGPLAAKPSEPPPPFPPPPPFVPLDTKTVENQIGLLKPYYQQRMSYAAPPAPSIPSIPPFPTNIPGMFSVPYHGQPPQYPPQVPPVPQMPPAPPAVQATLPDDQPTPVHTKLGPLGQVLKSGASANTSKKKAPAKPKGGGGGTLPGLILPDGEVPPDTPAATPATIPPETPKKPKPATSKKKKTATIEVLPPVIFAQ